MFITMNQASKNVEGVKSQVFCFVEGENWLKLLYTYEKSHFQRAAVVSELEETNFILFIGSSHLVNGEQRVGIWAEKKEGKVLE